MTLIKIKNLTKKFNDLTALKNLNLEIKKNEILGILGSDGAGKTTLLRILASILEPTSGEVKIKEFDLKEDPEKIKTIIGYMPQRFGLYEDLTVLENINFYADIYQINKKEKKTKIEKLLNFTQLLPFKDRKTRELSGGMKQKLGLICTLIHIPEILILDEPTAGVDPLSRREFWKILYELLIQEITIIISTSYLDEAERCNRAAVFYEGNLLICDNPEKIASGKTLEEAFIELIKNGKYSLG